MQAGGSYDSSVVDSDDRLPDIPSDDQLRFSIGSEFQAADNITLSASYSYVYFGSADIDKVSLPGGAVIDGDYGPNEIHFVGMHVGVNF